MKSQQVRQQFLDFFQSKAHKIVPSAPMVNKDDPTLMFVNAGMNPFKDYFLGNKTAKDKRVADTQKCLRVSGKHNDLEEVGKDTYHHTLFEMLGNWSFGDYSKEKAIDLAWNFLIKKCELNIDRIYVTVFEGDIVENLDQDKESFNFWTKYLPKERILFGNKKDNFWEMGDIGPCGPCSEVHYDNRSDAELNKISVQWHKCIKLRVQTCQIFIKQYKSQFYDPNSNETDTVISSKDFFDSIEYRAKDLLINLF